jgi:hypothetical protein
MRNFIFLIAITIALTSRGQIIFQEVVDSPQEDFGETAFPSAEGGYYIFGSTSGYGAGNFDYYLLKTNAIGDTLWTRTFGQGSAEYAESACLTSDSGCIMVGASQSFGNGAQILIVKCDKNGNVIFSKTCGGASDDYPYSIKQTTDGGYVIAGYTQSYAFGYADGYIIKTDPSGNVTWTTTIGRNFGQVCMFHVIQTNDGGYALSGHNEYDLYIVRLTQGGNILWTKTWGGPAIETGDAIIQTLDGGFLVGGTTSTYGSGMEDLVLIKTDLNGNFTWVKTYGGSNRDVLSSIINTTDGNYAMTGGTESFGVQSINSYLLKVNPAGIVLWSKTFGSVGMEITYSIKETSDGGFILAGNTYNSFNVVQRAIYIIKTDTAGKSSCNETSPNTISTNAPTALNADSNSIGTGGTFTNQIVQTDQGANKNILCILSTNEGLPENHGAVLYPNPSNGVFNCELSDVNEGTLDIYNTMGVKVYSALIKDQTLKIDLSHLPKGIYLVTLQHEKGIERGKIVVQ